jgi:hypothetical protein|tara:strand:- start:8004 stop:8180 length:177 start_codon:yes stop_codon:yes gene_type:complete
MKKLFYFLFTFAAIALLNSCFLFKPVQKRCPAYSINLEEDLNQDLITQQKIKTTKEDF